ncbi:hypothetical protein [Schaalia hyovaginalis]|uniref:Type II toxin-antitoxin system HicA family toxin n=1 Tax=Schaalia hyovaginalis TaxID=29316 RepID=A0A923E3E0_9ACTO|nr:hypothetical protein [Schaalia hyovaginalis]MBB6333657.1 hypothetical protein [Schaalia hyovaginalis]
MKRVDLMKRLATIAKQRGEELIVVEGGSHTKVRIGQAITMVPRHREISEGTARGIIKKMEEE